MTLWMFRRRYIIPIQMGPRSHNHSLPNIDSGSMRGALINDKWNSRVLPQKRIEPSSK